MGKNKNRIRTPVENKITIFSTIKTPTKPSIFELFLHNRPRRGKKSKMPQKHLRMHKKTATRMCG